LDCLLLLPPNGHQHAGVRAMHAAAGCPPGRQGRQAAAARRAFRFCSGGESNQHISRHPVNRKQRLHMASYGGVDRAAWEELGGAGEAFEASVMIHNDDPVQAAGWKGPHADSSGI